MAKRYTLMGASLYQYFLKQESIISTDPNFINYINGEIAFKDPIDIEEIIIYWADTIKEQRKQFRIEK